MKVEVKRYMLKFNERVFTSRGHLDDHEVYFVIVREGCEIKGIGECAPLKGLSEEYGKNVYERLSYIAKQYEKSESIEGLDFDGMSSAKFAFECADLMYRNGERMYDTAFTRCENGIKINGLVWMGDVDVMLQRAEEKYKSGFRCLKFKIGSKEYNDEMRMLEIVRERYGNAITIRVDANGAYDGEFYLNEIAPVLKRLDIHSIEQPVAAIKIEELQEVISKSPIPVALDESLIGVRKCEEIEKMLGLLRPHYLVLKPTLCGGIEGTKDYINVAESYGMKYWLTSALESSVGLNSIAQFCSTLSIDIPQGLGTGMIYSNNLPSTLFIDGEELYYDNNSNITQKLSTALGYDND